MSNYITFTDLSPVRKSKRIEELKEKSAKEKSNVRYNSNC